MGILYPALPITATFVWFGLFGAHALRVKGEDRFREAWGAATLALMPAAIFWIWVVSGESDVIRRSLLLALAGAIVGACSAVWLGYVVHDWSAKAQTDSAPGTQVAQNDKPDNSIGSIVGNQGIITQGQTGNNYLLKDGQHPFGPTEQSYLLQYVSKQRKIVINVMPDAKAINLADRIYAFLRDSGYQVDPVNHFLMAAGPKGPPRGVSVNNPPDSTQPTTIWVGL